MHTQNTLCPRRAPLCEAQWPVPQCLRALAVNPGAGTATVAVSMEGALTHIERHRNLSWHLCLSLSANPVHTHTNPSAHINPHTHLWHPPRTRCRLSLPPRPKRASTPHEPMEKCATCPRCAIHGHAPASLSPILSRPELSTRGSSVHASGCTLRQTRAVKTAANRRDADAL